MERLTEHHYNKTMGAYMVCSGACIDDDFNCNNCKKLAEIVDRLAAYEDTGLEPEKVTAIKNALMGREIAKITEFDGIPIKRLQELAQAEKDGRLVILPPNAPLTLEELREMDGEPIYITGMGWKICYGVDESTAQAGIITGLTTRLYLNGFGKTWFVYRRRPEGGAT